MDLNQLFVPVAVGALLIVAVIAIVFNPSIMGVGFALIVIVGACTVWLLRQLYLAESEKDDR
jgi:Flp pilus assembly protein TadB